MDWLRQSVGAGLEDAERMSQDPDLESLRGSEFDALVEHARQNAAAARRQPTVLSGRPGVEVDPLCRQASGWRCRRYSPPRSSRRSHRSPRHTQIRRRRHRRALRAKWRANPGAYSRY
jgi:hypothetical protein